MMADTVAAYLRKLKDSQNRYLWEMSLIAGQPDRIFGKPVVINNDQDSAFSTNKRLVLFGDFAAYQIQDAGPPVFIRADELRVLQPPGRVPRLPAQRRRPRRHHGRPVPAHGVGRARGGRRGGDLHLPAPAGARSTGGTSHGAQIERRVLRGAELRAAGGRRIVGYAAVFNSLSEDLGGFREIILPGTFDRAISGEAGRAGALEP